MRTCLIGTAPPRRCGIATFTDDLRSALAAREPSNPPFQIALTDVGSGYDYGPDVLFDIGAAQLGDYRSAAEFIERSGVDVVCVQHEFGIFGGPSGRHLNELLDHVQAPVVTTLHTVLARPPAALRQVTRELAERSDRLIVLADRAVDLLADVYGVDGDRVKMIPHGVPDLPFADPCRPKTAIGAEGRTVLMTFGLLGPDKGIEVALDALPSVVADHPDVLYIVLGATHPEIVRHHGEQYREQLTAQVAHLGLQDHVLFENRYVDLNVLCRYLAATDLYITPYHGIEQIVSGTLAYAVGLGCGVVSTPYPYAEELLGDGRGRLVPFDDPEALAQALQELIGDRPARERMQRRAYDHARSMTWPAVADAYADAFREVCGSQGEAAFPRLAPASARTRRLPAPNFSFLRALTDDTAIFQHTRHGVPDRVHGYCTDDVGRALVAAIRGTLRGDAQASALVPTYLSFLSSAARDDGTFENLMGFDRRFIPLTDSEDTLGQAVWGLGTVAGAGTDRSWRAVATELVERALPAVSRLHHTRAVAYAVCGLQPYLERNGGVLAARRTLRGLGQGLADRAYEHSGPGWTWFDDVLTYGNAKVPEALMLAAHACGRDDWRRTGLATLDFLLDATVVDERFDFVGNDGWYRRGGPRAHFGQQPLEAGYTAEACMLAYRLTGHSRYRQLADLAVRWLLGANRLGQALYDPATGRCRDGLDRHGVSANSGAESVISALLGFLAVPVDPEIHQPSAATGGPAPHRAHGLVLAAGSAAPPFDPTAAAGASH
ncbi:MAG: glycosyltransferase family 4 protein [Acidimicrobiales bacterium]